jgi:hypothetical protein
MQKHISDLVINKVKKKYPLNRPFPKANRRNAYRIMWESMNSYPALLLLEPSTSHVYYIFWNWEDVFIFFEEMQWRLDFDVLFTDEYQKLYGKKPVPMCPRYFFNKIVHFYDAETGYWVKEYDDFDEQYNAISDCFSGYPRFTKRKKKNGYIISSFKKPRLERIWTEEFNNDEKIDFNDETEMDLLPETE